MEITLLCNAGLTICCDNQTLLVDVPNCDMPPYASLGTGEWDKILNRQDPYQRICGLYYTHNHPDHYHKDRVAEFRKKWPDIPCFLPDENSEKGTLVMGPYVISYGTVEHAPMDVATPPHVVTWIRAGSKSIYIAADAKLDCHEHEAFLKGRVADLAFWNAMYLSRAETRELMRKTAKKNYIYHMPQFEPDEYGIWKKCRNNLRRYKDELSSVSIISDYPSKIIY